MPTKAQISEVMASLAKRRMVTQTPERRTEIARKGGRARQAKARKAAR